MKVSSCFALMLVVSISFSAYASTWRITPDGTGDAPTIQAGIDSAAAGDTVLVGPGYYMEACQETESGPSMLVMKSGVVLLAQAGQEATILDAQQMGRVICCDGVDSTASIIGFTVTGGSASGSRPASLGGAILCISNSSIRLCRLAITGKCDGRDVARSRRWGILRLL